MADLQGRAWVDGRVLPLDRASVPVTDRGFLLADGVFDSIRTYGGRPFLLGDHLDRLRRSAEALWLPVPWSDADLEGIVRSLLDGWPPGCEAVLRTVLTRGDGGHGLVLPEPQVPRLVVLCRPLPALPPEAYEEGVGLGVPATGRTKDQAVPAHVKVGNYLAGVLALREAREIGAVEALLRAADGSWAEATTSNLFCVARGTLLTPGEREHALPGVTRALVLRVAARAGIPVAERPVSDADLWGADEVFITSSIKEVVPVVRLETRPVGCGRPGPTTRRVMGLFAGAVARIQAEGVTRLAAAFPAA